MAEYRLTTFETSVIRVVDGACIPNDLFNTDWAEYQAWLAVGGIPDPPTPEINPQLDTKPARTVAEILGA